MARAGAAVNVFRRVRPRNRAARRLPPSFGPDFEVGGFPALSDAPKAPRQARAALLGRDRSLHPARLARRRRRRASRPSTTARTIFSSRVNSARQCGCRSSRPARGAPRSSCCASRSPCSSGAVPRWPAAGQCARRLGPLRRRGDDASRRPTSPVATHHPAASCPAPPGARPAAGRGRPMQSGETTATLQAQASNPLARRSRARPRRYPDRDRPAAAAHRFNPPSRRQLLVPPATRRAAKMSSVHARAAGGRDAYQPDGRRRAVGGELRAATADELECGRAICCRTPAGASAGPPRSSWPARRPLTRPGRWSGRCSC